MKRILVIIVLILAASQAFAAQSNIPVAFAIVDTARAGALGGAYVAVADDASAGLYNPAGIVNAQYKDITYMWTMPKWLVPYNYFAFVFPINKSRGVGFGLIVDGDQYMTEQSYIFSYCENFDWLQSLVKGVNAGLNFKMQFANFGGNPETDPNKVKGSAWGVGLDLGLMWAVNSNIQLGVMMRDLVSSIKWETLYNPDSIYESVPMTTSIGFKYSVQDFMATAEVSDIDKLKMGIEATVFTYIDLRAGYSQTLDFEAYKEFMLGLGIGHFEFGMKRELSMNIDMAFLFERLDNTLKIQTSFKFK